MQRSVVLISYADLILQSTYSFIHIQLNTLKSGGPLQSSIIKLLWGFFFKEVYYHKGERERSPQ